MYPPPPYADAICGVPVAGEAIVGTIWVYTLPGGLTLGGYSPVISNISGEQVPAAGLWLGGFLPEDVGQHVVFPAGLQLGAEVPPVVSVSVSVVAPQPGLALGATAPSLIIFSTLFPAPAGLLLGAEPPIFAGQVLLFPVEDCVEEDLIPAVCVEADLVPAACGALVLQPVGCD